MYCNENKDGAHKGFWMIDNRGVKQPVYDMHKRYYEAARRHVAEFLDERGRVPSDEEFRSFAVDLLDSP
jgi:hypothetical protein